MTEQEIVEYLKENKTKGVALGFMPKDVQDWCEAHKDDLIFYSIHEDWRERTNWNKQTFSKLTVFALPQDFELPPKPQSGWVEFEITDNAFICSDKKEHGRWHFFWWDWQAFLTESDNSGLGYTAFGGWQYDGSDWNTYPLIQCGEKASSGVSFSMDDKPMIPKKIRFWMESR